MSVRMKEPLNFNSVLCRSGSLDFLSLVVLPLQRVIIEQLHVGYVGCGWKHYTDPSCSTSIAF